MAPLGGLGDLHLLPVFHHRVHPFERIFRMEVRGRHPGMHSSQGKIVTDMLEKVVHLLSSLPHWNTGVRWRSLLLECTTHAFWGGVECAVTDFQLGGFWQAIQLTVLQGASEQMFCKG